MEFKPTANEQVEIGGNRNFGSNYFTPNITNVTGTYTTSGVYQIMGKILFWAFELTGTSTCTSSVFTPPISPQRITDAATYKAGEMSHQGMFMDQTAMYIMNAAGTCSVPNGTVTNGVRRFSGWYWIK